MIIGECKSGCELISSFEYEYRIYKKWIISGFDNREIWTLLNTSEFASVGKGSLKFFKNVSISHYVNNAIKSFAKKLDFKEEKLNRRKKLLFF